MSKLRGLYIHVPFCVGKCPYCDFYSVTDDSLFGDYAAAVVRNLRRYGESFDTVYFGGGTPSLLSEYFGEITRHTNTAHGAEITAECNPATADEHTLELLLNAGVNRLSVGVQSLCDNELLRLGRLHNAAQARQLIESAYHAGFRSISADIMLGIPGQTARSLGDTLESLAALPINHISAYMLSIEPNTPFGKSPPKDAPDDEQTAELYALCVRLCESYGFGQYEISNFAKAGAECRHNLKYWRDEEYLGIGPAAHSYYNGKRFAVPRDIAAFIKEDAQPTQLTDGSAGDYDERVMLGLRLREGIPEELYKPLEKGLWLIPREYYTLENGRLALTSKGFAVYNYIVSLLLAGVS